MPDKHKDELVSWLESVEQTVVDTSRVIIVPHDYPDPDALASAAGMVLLLGTLTKAKVTLAYTGLVSRPENREMLKHIPFTMRNTAALRIKDKKTPVCFVDTAPWAGNVTPPDLEGHSIILDHHPVPSSIKRSAYTALIQPDVGATSTLTYELLLLAEVQIPTWLATLMIYAISTETLDMMREVTQRDVDAYSALISNANLATLGKIRHAPLPRDYYGYLQEAMTRAQVYGRINWTVMSGVEKPEIVAELADFLLRMERISWSFCIARMGDALFISLRSCQPKAKCGKLLKRAIGRRGSAGGHDSMAAGTLPLTTPAQWSTQADTLIEKLIRLIDAERLSDDSDLSDAGQLLVPEAVAPLEEE